MQKDKGQLIDELTKKADTNHTLVEQMAEQNEQLEQAKKIIKTLADDLSMYSGNYQKEILESKQFLKENE